MTDLVGFDTHPSTLVFLHAHPDDEAIFTGGTIARLAVEGHRVVVVYATSGELGHGAGADLGALRRDEARRACETLGAQRVVFLDHHDSGVGVHAEHRPWGAFANANIDSVADHLADIADNERGIAIITYDPNGVYGHPDHIHAHHVGAMAAERSSMSTWYEVTVDREYLHFVDTHVAAIAGTAVAQHPLIGSPTVEISTTVDVRGVLDRKHDAIAAHHSQVDDPTFGANERFGEVYGFEWFIRHGPATVLDDLHMSTAPADRGRRSAFVELGSDELAEAERLLEVRIPR